MKNKKIKLLNAFLLFTLICSGCSNKTSSSILSSSIESSSTSASTVITDATIVEFDVKEDFIDIVDIGDSYPARKVVARDNYGNYYIATITITDPDGTLVTPINDSFICSKIGQYSITYTVNYNVSDSISKTMYVDVVDVSAPTIDTDLYIHNICRPGQIIDLDTISINDNSMEEVESTINVKFNGVEEVEIIDNKFTAEKQGTYVLEITSTDSYDNTLNEEYYIHTYMDFENGYSFDLNDSYGTQISNKYSFDGESSYEFGAFDNNVSWFNDYSMLGNIKIIDDEAKYVSFWIYFDNKDYTNIMQAIYHDTYIYSSKGTKLGYYHLGGYEMKGAEWYRVVVNMDELVFEGEFFDHDDAVANPDTLGQIPFYFGVWDVAGNCNASKVQKIYIDNVELTNNPDDMEYAPPTSDYYFPENCILDFETPEQKEAIKTSWRSDGVISNKKAMTGDYSYKFTPYITYSSITLTGFCSGIGDLSEYDYISTSLYIDDNSGNNVYDDNTRFAFSLVYKYEDGKTKTLQTYSVKENKKWINLVFNLGEFNQYSLTTGGFYISMWKYIYGEVVVTYEYEGVDIYFDDFYAGTSIKYVPGEIVAELPYASTSGENIYTQVANSETGYINAEGVAKYGMAHGTFENYSMFNKNYLGDQADTTKSHLTNTQIKVSNKDNNDNVLYVIEADEAVCAKFTLNEDLFNLYFYGNIYIRKYSANAQAWQIVESITSASYNTRYDEIVEAMQCEYQFLEPGDKLVLELVNYAGGIRYFTNASGIKIAKPLEEGQTITLNKPTNIQVNEHYGLYTISFDNVKGASSYVMNIKDNEGNIVSGYENVSVTNGQEFTFDGLTTGNYKVEIKAIGTGIYNDSEYSEAKEFTFTALAELSIEEVKSALLNPSNSFNAVDNIMNIKNGETDENMTIGLLAGEEEISVVPGGQNGYCGFTHNADGSGRRVQFLAETAPDAFYYTYKALQSGYIYINQTLLTWNGGVQSSVVATVNGVEVYNSGVRTHVGDGKLNDKIAVYLEKGEILKIQVNHLSNPSRSVFSLTNISITFVATKEATLPSGYNSLIEYLEA